VALAENRLVDLGVKIGAHPTFGRADIVAYHPDHGEFIIEVEGKSSRQREQAIYSALGQVFLQMTSSKQMFALAVPDAGEWERQVKKIPEYVKRLTGLVCWLVSEEKIRQL
jgi:hypothetical protein